MKFILFLIALLTFRSMVAQQPAMFESALYFEDGIGNKDTLIIGFDTSANEVFNPAFGEAIISEPFDSAFEVRATHGGSFFGNPNPLFSKKIVGSAEMVYGIEDCFGGGLVVIFPRIIHQPLKIKWNKENFQGSDCLLNSYLSPDQFTLIVDPPWVVWEVPDYRFGCMAVHDSMLVYMDTGHQAVYETPFEYVQEINGNSDTIFGVALFFDFFPSFSPCNVIIPVNEKVVSVSNNSIYPVPASDRVKIENSGNKPVMQIEIFDLTGRLLSDLKTNLPPEEILDLDITGLENGIYFIKIKTVEGKYDFYRIVKF